MERYYIFFRCWEHFSPDSDFPFEKFNSYPDSSFMPRRPRKPEPSPECSPGCRNAFNLGWITTTELRKFGDWSPSPKCFLMRVDEAVFAADIVEALTEWWPTSRCRVLYDHLNPRFGYVPASQFKRAVRGVINAGMDRLPKLKPADVRDVREELQQLAAAKAMELGQSLICIYKSGTPPEVTVAVPINADPPDEEINDAVEAYAVCYGRNHKKRLKTTAHKKAGRLAVALEKRARQKTARPLAPEGLVPVSCDTATPTVAANKKHEEEPTAPVHPVQVAKAFEQVSESKATATVDPPRDVGDTEPAERQQGSESTAGEAGATQSGPDSDSGDKEPDDLMYLSVVKQNYIISQSSLDRDIRSGKLKAWRKKPRAKRKVSKTACDLIYNAKKR